VVVHFPCQLRHARRLEAIVSPLDYSGIHKAVSATPLFSWRKILRERLSGPHNLARLRLAARSIAILEAGLKRWSMRCMCSTHSCAIGRRAMRKRAGGWEPNILVLRLLAVPTTQHTLALFFHQLPFATPPWQRILPLADTGIFVSDTSSLHHRLGIIWSQLFHRPFSR